jgi:hypothetical protein
VHPERHDRRADDHPGDNVIDKHPSKYVLPKYVVPSEHAAAFNDGVPFVIDHVRWDRTLGRLVHVLSPRPDSAAAEPRCTCYHGGGTSTTSLCPVHIGSKPIG